MTYGLRVWDAAGLLRIDTATNLARYVGGVTITVAANVASGSGSIPGLVSTDDIVADPNTPNGFNISVSGTTVTVTRPSGFTGQTVTYYINAFRLI